MSESARPKLYWCATQVNDEDWFVIARSKRQARSFFVDEEGYAPDDVEPELLRSMPEDFDGACPDWAQLDLLKPMGATVISDDTPRIVMLDGRIFTEGTLDAQIRIARDDALEAAGHGRPNGTKREPTP